MHPYRQKCFGETILGKFIYIPGELGVPSGVFVDDRCQMHVQDNLAQEFIVLHEPNKSGIDKEVSVACIIELHWQDGFRPAKRMVQWAKNFQPRQCVSNGKQTELIVPGEAFVKWFDSRGTLPTI